MLARARSCCYRGDMPPSRKRVALSWLISLLVAPVLVLFIGSGGIATAIFALPSLLLGLLVARFVTGLLRRRELPVSRKEYAIALLLSVPCLLLYGAMLVLTLRNF